MVEYFVTANASNNPSKEISCDNLLDRPEKEPIRGKLVIGSFSGFSQKPVRTKQQGPFELNA